MWGNFSGPQKRKLMNDVNFAEKLGRVWNSCVNNVREFLGNNLYTNYQQLVN